MVEHLHGKEDETAPERNEEVQAAEDPEPIQNTDIGKVEKQYANRPNPSHVNMPKNHFRPTWKHKENEPSRST